MKTMILVASCSNAMQIQTLFSIPPVFFRDKIRNNGIASDVIVRTKIDVFSTNTS